MIDTHGHLNLKPLIDNWAEYWHKAQAAGVTKIIVPGTNLATSQTALDLANQDKSIFAAVGIHPHDTLEIEDTLAAEIELTQMAKQPNVVAVGECGLDYFYPEYQTQSAQEIQKKWFEFQLELANTQQLPVSIHVRAAQQDVLSLLAKYRPKGVLHCFSGDLDYLSQALKLGLYISLAGNVTFSNAKDLVALLPQIPQDRLILETDAPYLNPTRGEFPNQPAQISQTYQFVAQALQLTTQELVDQVNLNVNKLFDI